MNASQLEQSTNVLAKYPKIDLLISNGQIIDGLGHEPYIADIAVVDDQIVFIGDADFPEINLTQRVTHRIDATGKIVTPGFIDLHSHGNPLKTPNFDNFIAMGVTTITLGQDGSSPEIEDLSQWLDKVEKNGIGVNLAMFIGHGTLRTITGIGRKAVPTNDELVLMTSLLDKTLEYTFGLSTGLEYNPGLNANKDELISLAKVVGKHHRLIMSHMRNEDQDKLQQSINELLSQGAYSKVHISHIKSVYGHGKEEAETILKTLADARKAGIEISADIYPYNASYAGLSLLFPVWAKTTEQFNEAMLTRKNELEQFLNAKIERRNGPEATLLGTPPYKGQTLADLSRELKLTPAQILMKLGPIGTSGAYFIMDDELQSRLLIDPNISISSDGSPTGFHPRGHGAFAKIIEEYVVIRKQLTLTEAIRKMTSQAANILGLHDRGQLNMGQKADILIFDPNNVKALATYPEPHHRAQGFDWVIINGEIVKESNEIMDTLKGKVLKPRE